MAAGVRGTGWQAQDGLHSCKGKVIILTQVTVLVVRSSVDLRTEMNRVSSLLS